MRHNSDALEQLIDGADAIPALVGLMAPSHPTDIQVRLQHQLLVLH